MTELLKTRRGRDSAKLPNLRPTPAPCDPHSVRIALSFPSNLLKGIDDAARHFGVDRAEFIRNAVARYIDELEAKAFERELAAGYMANADLNRALAAELAGAEKRGPSRPKRRLKLNPPLIRPAGRRIDLASETIYELIELP